MRNLIVVITTIVTILGCTTQMRIDSDSDNTYDLSSYKSFSIEDPDLEANPSQISINPILLQRLHRSIEKKLIKLGFEKSSEPDMVVKFFLATDREVERSRSYGSWYRRGYFDDTDQRYYRVDKDALTIRFHDAKSEEVVWYAFSRFNRSQTPENQENVDALVEEAIARFNSVR